MKIKNIIFLFIILMTSCHDNIKYHSYRTTSTDGWHKSDSIVYNIPSSIAKGKYIMEIGIRHTDNYSYKNIWIEISSNMNKRHAFKKDSVQLFLSNDEGKWLGKGFTGIYQKDSILNKILFVDSLKDNSITVRHIMTDKNLKGIRDVGIKLIKI